MAGYDREKIYKRCISVVKKHKLVFIDEIVAYLPIGRKTFYEWWPAGSDESDNLKELLTNNKVVRKVAIRQKLESGKGSDLIAAYKLLGTDRERKLLSTTYQEINEKVTIDKIDLASLSTEELIARSKVVSNNE